MPRKPGNLRRGHDGAAVTPSSPDQVAAAMGPVKLFCLRSTIARLLLIRDGDRGDGEQKVKARLHAPTWKTEDAVDCTRTTKMLRQCPFAIAQQPLYNVIALNCCAAMGPVKLFCLRSTIARLLLIRDGDRGDGEQKVKARLHAPTWKTEDAVDCTRTTKMLRQCPFAIAQQPLYNVIALNCCAEQSQKQCP